MKKLKNMNGCHHQTFLDRINYLRHTPQYQKKFDALMWLSKYRDHHNGHGISKYNTCSACHITPYQYECVMAGSPLVSVELCDKVIKYYKNRYLKSTTKS